MTTNTQRDIPGSYGTARSFYVPSGYDSEHALDIMTSPDVLAERDEWKDRAYRRHLSREDLNGATTFDLDTQEGRDGLRAYIDEWEGVCRKADEEGIGADTFSSEDGMGI